MRPLTRILAPVDLQCVSWEPLEYAGWLAAPSGAIVDLLYVPPTDGHAGQVLEQARYDRFVSILASLIARFGSANSKAADATPPREPIFIGNMEPGNVVELILDFASRGDHDVIVMGTHNRIGISLPIRGSVTEQIVRRAQCPVLTVPSLRMDDHHEAHPMI